MPEKDTVSIVMMGATGAVGGQVLTRLLKMDAIQKITLLGRNLVQGMENAVIHQHQIDVLQPDSYTALLSGHQVAICTLGVGQPSKVSKEVFLKIDKLAVLNFAKACKNAGIKHFQLLASVGIHAQSSSFYLRSKGELVEEIKALQFERFSIFEPSMILTPTNRYGVLQGITLMLWPLLTPLLVGGLRKYRGVHVETLGQAIAKNILVPQIGIEHLRWDDFQGIANGEVKP